MPSFNIIKNIEFLKTFRNQNIIGKYDLKNNNFQEHFEGEIPIEQENWNIGLIVGNSGTGKTTIAKQIFKQYYNNYNIYTNQSIIDEMPKNKSMEEITKIFNITGFSSIPSWLKKYEVLSQGEKMRVDLCKAILTDNDIIIFDEFTSVVNREIAKIASMAINKTIKKLNKKFIAISCHFDIIDWLQPDWIYDTNSFFFKNNKTKTKN